jgi:exodeoxyribonuclease-3
VYTYWDYTQLRFPKKQGMRIDFILGSPGLAARVAHAEIVRDERKPGKKGTPAPSDHAPVIVELSDG